MGGAGGAPARTARTDGSPGMGPAPSSTHHHFIDLHYPNCFTMSHFMVNGTMTPPHDKNGNTEQTGYAQFRNPHNLGEGVGCHCTFRSQVKSITTSYESEISKVTEWGASVQYNFDVD